MTYYATRDADSPTVELWETPPSLVNDVWRGDIAGGLSVVDFESAVGPIHRKQIVRLTPSNTESILESL